MKTYGGHRFGHYVHFTMNGNKYIIPSSRTLTNDEFCPMLYYTRRLLGYVVFPRWFMARLFLCEVIENMKKNGIYKFKLKQSIKNLIMEFDMLEQKHRADFDQEFLEVMAGNLSCVGLGKINELRGAVGGVLMNGGVKKYLQYSYPYTFLNLCYDNTVCYDQCMKQVAIKYGVDFSKVFTPLKGERVYAAATQMMNKYVDAMGEDISKRNITFKGSGCIEKLDAISKLLLDEGNLHKAFSDAYDELPDDKRKDIDSEMNIWVDDREELAELLSQKYRVIHNN